MGRGELTARRAGTAIALTTLVVTIAAGVLVRLLDRHDFPTLGRGLWWAVQTVTTVGYGDVTPTSTTGRAIATVVMLTGIGFVSVVTAAITASFVEAARRRLGVRDETIAAELRELATRLDRIEQRITHDG
jgi:voltage-gated potassium channel